MVCSICLPSLGVRFTCPRGVGTDTYFPDTHQVRATESLLSLSHTLKLLFLLNDEDEGSSRIVDTQQEHMTQALAEAKDAVKTLLGEALAKQ
jgi:hypothetical protein